MLSNYRKWKRKLCTFTRLKKNVILQDMDDFSGDELCEIGE